MTELQRGGRDQKIFEGDVQAFLGLFALNSSSQPSGLQRNRIHGHVASKFIDKRLSPIPKLYVSGAIYPVGQLDDCYYRQSQVYFAPDGAHLFQDLAYAVSSTLAGDDDTGIDD